MLDPQNSLSLSPTVDADGLVRVGGVPLGRLTGRGTLVIKDTDRYRSRCRGTCFVEVSLIALVKADEDLAQQN